MFSLGGARSHSGMVLSPCCIAAVPHFPHATHFVQESKVGEALAAAVSQLPANRPERQLLQQHLAQYSQLLSAKLVELQSAEEVVQPQLVKKHKTALPSKPEAQCLSVLCHRQELGHSQTCKICMSMHRKSVSCMSFREPRQGQDRNGALQVVPNSSGKSCEVSTDPGSMRECHSSRHCAARAWIDCSAGCN